jgi:hypothetical protein
MGEKNACKMLVGKPEGKRPLVRRGCIWEDNIKMDLGEIELGVWTGFIWLKIGISAGCREHGNEPSGSIKGGEFLD